MYNSIFEESKDFFVNLFSNSIFKQQELSLHPNFNGKLLLQPGQMANVISFSTKSKFYLSRLNLLSRHTF